MPGALRSEAGQLREVHAVRDALDRRGFLRILGSAAAGAFAGCGGGPSGAPGADLDGSGADLAAACHTPSAGAAPGYCLVEPIVARVPGARRLAAGQVILFNVDDKSAVIVARDAGGLYARSAICPHQCCLIAPCGDVACTEVRTNPGDCAAAAPVALVVPGRAFICPCHGSEFDADGGVLSGPAAAPLPALPLTFDGDDALVDLGARAARAART